MRQLPEIKLINGVGTLYVDGKPFIALGGELHNSSSSSTKWMREKVWPNLRPIHLNSVIATVSWEQIEPKEDVFDFTELDDLIADAEEIGVKLTLIWFGLWKNGRSTYVPEWVKLNRKKYWVINCPDTTRISSHYHEFPSGTISPFCEAAISADAKAFGVLMKHIKETDKNGTVILMQVENEMGLLGGPRDFSEDANKHFEEQIPDAVADAFNVKGTWAEAFGSDAEEYFMAWYYATAVEKIASTGKKAYNIPMYVNAWLQQYPDCAGEYPAGGPIAKMMKLWRIAAKSICMYAPDIYVSDFEKVVAEYSDDQNPLFIPETVSHVSSAASVFLAVCEYSAIGFHPFGIEDIFGKGRKLSEAELAELNINPAAFCDEGTSVYLPASYQLLSSMMHLLLDARGTKHLRGFYHGGFDGGKIFEFEEYDIHIKYGEDAPGKPPAGGGILEIAPNEFYLFGTNFRAKFVPKKNENRYVQYLRIEEGTFENGKWERGRILNGDEHSVSIPYLPRILHVKLFKY